MNSVSIQSAAITAVQLTRAATIFDRIANGLVERVRQALGVPDRLDEDIEQELVGLRAELDEFFPEYQQLFGGLLLEHIGREHAPSVLAALSGEAIQRYFRAAPEIDAELQALFAELVRQMSLAAREASQPGRET